MKKYIVPICMLLMAVIPLVSFKPATTPANKIKSPTSAKHYKTFLVSVLKKQTYYDTGATTSRSFTRRVFYEVYTDGTSNIVQVMDLSTSSFYTASGHNYLATVNGFPNTPCSTFTVYDGGVQTDSYDGPSGA